jgi:hypothetical protein
MEVIEKNILIAKRQIGNGDIWDLCTPDGTIIFDGDGKGFPSLTHVLEKYFQKYEYKGDFIISPSKGKIYILTTEEVTPPEPKKFNIYGDR